MKLKWVQKCRKRETATASMRRYRSKDHRYAVVEVVSKYDLPKRWLAIRTMGDADSEYVISRHRTKHRAQLSCDRHNNERDQKR